MDAIWQDVRHATRTLLRSRGFTAVAVLTLALGIGATVALFSVADALLLRPLPVHEPGRLVHLEEIMEGDGRNSVISYPRYTEYRNHAGVFSGIAVEATELLPFAPDGEAELALSQVVSGDYFWFLGIRPAHGRLLTPEDDAPGAAPVAVLSHRVWQRDFGGDPSVLGRTVRVNHRPVTVVGVAPEEFGGLLRVVDMDLWIPLGTYAQLSPNERVFERRQIWLSAVGRLRPGITRGQAEEALSGTVRGFTEEFTGGGAPRRVRLEAVTGMPGGMRAAAVGVLSLLLATAGLLLAIAGTNVGAILLSRATVRRREMAVRAALGASRAKLVRQLLTESIVLSLLGGAAGVLLAVWLVDLFPLFLAMLPHPLRLAAEVDVRALGFALLVSLATGIVFGLVPALGASRPDLVPALKDAVARGGGRTRLRSAFVVVQLTLSLLLLATSGLFVRALQQALSTDLGFDPDEVITATVDVQEQGYDGERREAYFRELVQRMESLPGVESASLAAMAPLGGGTMKTGIGLDGGARPGDEPLVAYNVVGAGYLRTLRMPLVAGRDFAESDRAGAPGVAVVNESFARRFFPGQSAMGQRFRMNSRELEIVGIARDGKYRGIRDEPEPFFFVPFQQHPRPWMMLLVRARGDASALLPRVRSEFAALDPAVLPAQVAELERLVGVQLVPQRIASILVGAFGVVGLLLAGVGLYGVLAYSVTQRTHEIGVRLALGARRSRVLWMVVRQGLLLAVAGIAAGLTAALGAARLFDHLLFGVSPRDPVTLAAVATLLGLVALLASYLPARRATRVDPMTALRAE